MDWSGVPGSLQGEFFILFMNRTRPNFDEDKNTTSFLRIANSSKTWMNVSNLPVFSQYTVRVYLIDVNGDVFKSEGTVVETDEGGKLLIL